MSVLRTLLWILSLAALVALVLSFGGVIHPAGDSLAVFRLYWVAGAMLGGLVLAFTGIGKGLVVLAAALILAGPTALSYRGHEETPEEWLTLYQKNLYFRNDDLEATARDILESGADIVTLEEVSPDNMILVQDLRAAYPTQSFCPFTLVIGGTVILSKYEAASEVRCGRRGGLTLIKLETPLGPLWVGAVHLHWPWPYGQDRHLDSFFTTLDEIEGPAVIGGDFNMVPWGYSVRTIARATRTEKAGPTRATLVLSGGLVPLPIDHVLVPKGWRATMEVRPEFGSDHRGVLVRFGP